MTPVQKRRIWVENFRQAFKTVASHKFRSFLTVLGVLVGVITVVLVASILTGMRGQLVGMIEEFGTNNIYAFHLNTGVNVGRRSREEMQRKPLQLKYVEAIKARADAVEDVGYQLFPRYLRDRTVKYEGHEYYSAQLEAFSPNMPELTNQHLAMGRFLMDIDNQHRLYNCVIGSAVAEALFPNINPLGKQLLIGGKKFTVVGVLEKAKANVLGSSGDDQQVTIPFETLKKISPREDFLFMVIRAKEGQLSRAMDQVEQVLRMERKLKADQPDDFSLSTADSVIQQFDNITAGVGMITIAISMVGLLVGGIGVMNIMLVSVRERTREIGVRKAIGARSRDISVQFLIEAMTLTGLGGALGILIAALVGVLLSLLVPNLPATIPMWAVSAAFLLSVAIGLVFGVWPAVKASHLDPIECLRYE